jgi:hypothetical protein
MRLSMLKLRLQDALTNLPAILLLVLILAGFATFYFVNAREPGFASSEGELCRHLYAGATTWSDTLAVDRQRPRNSRRPELTCGAMRTAGSLRPRGT